MDKGYKEIVYQTINLIQEVSAVIAPYPPFISLRLAFLTSGYTSTVFTWAP